MSDLPRVEISQTNRVLIGLGGNLPLGDLQPPDVLRAALVALAKAGLPAQRVSRFWRTAPVPASDQPDFFNAVAQLDPGPRTPAEVLAILLDTERAFGRTRRVRWDARTLDLDLLDADGLVCRGATAEDLTLPHPRLHERLFVLGPLSEVAPDWRHPILGKTALQLAAALPDDQIAAPA